MTEKELKELEILRAKSPYSLPDNPSQSGWSTKQIKEKFYSGLEYIYSLFRETRTASENEIAAMKALVDVINAQYVAIMTGQGGIGAERDSEGNKIVDTYAKKENLIDGTEPVLSYIDSEGNSKVINLLEVALTTLNNAFTAFKQTIETNGVAKSTEAEKATKDSAGNIIKDFYATVTALKLVSDEILNIKNGATTVKRAYQDQHGNMIDTNYVKVNEVVDNLNSNETKKPLSANQGRALKEYIDTAVRNIVNGAPEALDTIAELAAALKGNADIVDVLTASIGTKANQTYVDEKLGDIQTLLEAL